MRRILRLSVVGTLLQFAGAAATAGSPGLNTIDPSAAERGVESRLELNGVDLRHATELVVPFAAEVKIATAPTADKSASRPSFVSESIRISLTPAADVAPGIYPIRVRTPEGISNLRLIEITDLPVVRAREPNGRYRLGKLDLEQAQPITLPAVIAGGRLAGDVDVFRFSARKGERLTFVTETRRLGLTPDPILRLRDSRGRTVTYAHDTPGLRRDERIDWTFAETGDYFVELQSEGTSGWNNHYVLKVGDLNYARSVFPLGGRRGEKVRFEVTDRDGKSSSVEARVPDDPTNDHWHLPLPDYRGSLPWRLASGNLTEILEQPAAHAQPVDWPTTINGRINQPGEEDRYQIAVKPGQTVRLEMEAYYLGSALDGALLVYDPIAKKLLAQSDDQRQRNPDPALEFTVPEGTREVIVAVRDCLQHGGLEYGYRLTIDCGGPDFYLWLGKAQNPSRTNEENESWFRMDASDTLSLPIGVPTKLHITARRNPQENDVFYKGPRQGLQGPIRLRAENAPPGVTVEPAEIPAGKTDGELIVMATADAPRHPFELVIVGEGAREDGSVVRRIAERRLYLADPQMFALPWNWRVQKVTCVVTDKVN